MGVGATRGGRGFRGTGRSTTYGSLDGCRRKLRPGSLHFINGIFEANRNRAPVILIASQIIRDELGFDFIQEVDFKQIYKSCSVFCDMIYTAEQARRKTVNRLSDRLVEAGCRRSHRPGGRFRLNGAR